MGRGTLGSTAFVASPLYLITPYGQNDDPQMLISSFLLGAQIKQIQLQEETETKQTTTGKDKLVQRTSRA